jgi:hypothetical protein
LVSEAVQDPSRICPDWKSALPDLSCIESVPVALAKMSAIIVVNDKAYAANVQEKFAVLLS